MLLRFHLPTLSENTEAFRMSRIENLVCVPSVCLLIRRHYIRSSGVMDSHESLCRCLDPNMGPL